MRPSSEEHIVFKAIFAEAHFRAASKWQAANPRALHVVGQ
jgi:hypothetical protein